MNPLLPIDVYIADGEPHVFADRVYLFGSHDKENGETYCMLDYEFYSAPLNDLNTWTSKGISYSAKQDPLYREDNCYMYAPDCVRGNDGRYYLYYCLSGYRGKGGYGNPISVAVCDTPDGCYEYYGYVRNKDGTAFKQKLCFDPAVINDEGVIRICFGSDLYWFDHAENAKARRELIAKITGNTADEIDDRFDGAFIAVLNDDMLTLKDEPVRISDLISGDGYHEHRFFEGSSLRKINGVYYFIYSSIRNHELCYATSKYPDRDFLYRGTIISNGDVGYNGRKEEERLNHTGTNHGSIEKINDEWYVFYHRLTHNSDYSRQACAEKIVIEADGFIPQVEVSSIGLNGGALKEGSYPAVCCCNLSNGHMSHASNDNQCDQSEPCISSGDDERFITGITAGTLIGYKYFALKGPYQLEMFFRKGKGRVKVRLNEKEVGTIVLSGSARWQKYQLPIDVIEGEYALYLQYSGDDQAEFKEFTIKQTD